MRVGLEPTLNGLEDRYLIQLGYLIEAHMLTCSTCKLQLPESMFYSKGTGRLNSKCKKCFNDYCMKRWKDRKNKRFSFMEVVA